MKRLGAAVRATWGLTDYNTGSDNIYYVNLILLF